MHISILSAPLSHKTNSLFFIWFLILPLIACSIESTKANNNDSLPVLGDRFSGIVSPEKERQLGQAWLRALRSRAPLLNDTLAMEYLQNITYRLATNSQLADKRLSLVIVDSQAINAFAVPGGVVGVNAGLFISASSEGELAGVIAHELAHLSQRHFARTVEEAKKNQWLQGAALLASVLLIATSDSETGYAALATTQAAAVQSQLRFSRRNEREADRIAMTTMYEAGIDPSSVGLFFEKLQKTHQYSGEKPPEFLLTHPVTESRIADAKGRSAQYPAKLYPESADFYLIKARMEAYYASNVKDEIRRHLLLIEDSQTIQQIMTRYRLAMLFLKSEQYGKAEATLSNIVRKLPENIILQLTHAEIKLGSKDYVSALKILEPLHSLQPNNIALNLLYAETLMATNKPYEAIRLVDHVKTRQPESPHLWNLLTQAYSKTGDSIEVHLSRAEELFLRGKADQAIEQLEFAKTMVDKDFPLLSKIENRISAIEKSKRDLRF